MPFVLLVLNFLYRDSHVQTPQLIGIFGCVFPQKEFPCEDRSAAMQCPDLELFSRVIYEQNKDDSDDDAFYHLQFPTSFFCVLFFRIGIVAL